MKTTFGNSPTGKSGMGVVFAMEFFAMKGVKHEPANTFADSLTKFLLVLTGCFLMLFELERLS